MELPISISSYKLQVVILRACVYVCITAGVWKT